MKRQNQTVRRSFLQQTQDRLLVSRPLAALLSQTGGASVNRAVIFGSAAVLIIVILYFLLALGQANSAPPTLKIGLVAPFEGHYRATGYDALFAVKLALREYNQQQGPDGYRVELVALNDFNSGDEAQRQAQALVADPDIVGVVGHFSSDATRAALPVYTHAGLAVVIPWAVDDDIFNSDFQSVVSVAATRAETETQLESIINDMNAAQPEPLLSVNDAKSLPAGAEAVQLNTDAVTAGDILLTLDEQNTLLPVFGQADAGDRQVVQVAGPAANGLVFVSPGPNAADMQTNEAFVKNYQDLAGFPPPPRAILAYEAANVLLDSIEQAMITNSSWFNQLERADISEGISHVQHQGLTGSIVFDTSGRRLNAPVWVYQIANTTYPGVLVAP